MMAVYAELSMKQAAALSLQQELKEKELQVRGGPSHSLTAHTVHPQQHETDVGCTFSPQPPTVLPIIPVTLHRPRSKGAKSDSTIMSRCVPSSTLNPIYLAYLHSKTNQEANTQRQIIFNNDFHFEKTPRGS